MEGINRVTEPLENMLFGLTGNNHSNRIMVFHTTYNSNFELIIQVFKLYGLL
jgi:hypothetical protein